MSLVLALSTTLASAVSGFAAPLLEGGGTEGWLLALLVACGALAGFVYFWWRLGVAVFEEGMAQEPRGSSGLR